MLRVNIVEFVCVCVCVWVGGGGVNKYDEKHEYSIEDKQNIQYHKWILFKLSQKNKNKYITFTF